MANVVQSVVVQINGQTITLESNDGLTWSKTCIAPDASSYILSGGYYPLDVTATYETGTQTVIHGADDTTLGRQCRLVVKETYKPTISIAKPSATDGAYLKSASQPFEATLLDNSNGQSTGYSGVNLSTLSCVFSSLKLGISETVPASQITTEAVTGGYKISGTHSFEDSDDWVFTINVSDYDGNSADSAVRTFIIDTDAPELNVTLPTDNMKTGNNVIPVQGTTSDTMSGSVTISVYVNGSLYGTVPVVDGQFDGSITLVSSGEYTIDIIARDAAGNATPCTKTIWYSDAVPIIKSVTMVPNPVDNGRTYVITVEVE